MISTVQLNGPPVFYDPVQMQTALEASPNAGNNIARFVSVMEKAMETQKAVVYSHEETKREKEKENRIKAVATSEKETAIRDHKPQEVTLRAKRLRRPEDEDVPEEILYNPILGHSVDFKA